MKTENAYMILVTGALGQIGTELTEALRNRYGRERVIASDIFCSPPAGELAKGPYEQLDVLDEFGLKSIIEKYQIKVIYHLAAMLSARGEQQPAKAWDLNMNGLLHVLELAKIYRLKLFWPSSIAVFGPDAPKTYCPQNIITQPQTIYGISKLAGEQLCNWYKRTHDLDVRSIRYPGLISHTAVAGNGTTDYAVEIFHAALLHGSYECFLRSDTRLPMLYIADAVQATLDLMAAPREQLRFLAYNLAGLSFTPAELAAEIRTILPNFKIVYRPDERQRIADTWPQSMDDKAARVDWDWSAVYGLKRMTVAMFQYLSVNLKTVTFKVPITTI